MSGFVGGDGGFSIYVRSVNDYALNPSTQGQDPGSGPRGEKVYCRFHIAQHSRDREMIKLFISFFKCGRVNVRGNRCDFYVQDFKNICNKIITHFDKFPLYNVKSLDFKSFKQAAILYKEDGKNNTQAIQQIINTMNSNREF